MKHVTIFLSLVVLCVVSAHPSGLSKSIEFDRLLMHARNASAHGDYRTAVDSYAHAAKLDIGPPEGFYLDYASNLGALGRWKDAKAVLETYFQHFDKQGNYYDLALRRLVDAEDKVANHSEERVKPVPVPAPVGPGSAVAKPLIAPNAPKWTKTEATLAPASSSLPPMRTTQLERPVDPARATLEKLIGLYSGEEKDNDNADRSRMCDKTFSANKPHPASDCFYGYHRNMSLNAVDGSAVVGFVKVDYVREHRPASTGDQRDRKLTIYTKMEYYLAIRMWVTPGGLIQGQQRALCEFMVDEKVCTTAAEKGLTPLRAKMTPEGGIALESEKGGGPRLYTKVRTAPDAVRPDVVRAVPSLAGFVSAPRPRPEKPAEEPARSNSLGDTAGKNDEADDAVAAAAS